MPFRIIAGILGFFFFVQGISWLRNPKAAAEALGMPLLEGAGRSTQIGDISGFFLCLGGFALYGAYAQNAAFVRASACLVGLVSITRTIAWAIHDAPFTVWFIAVEVIASAALFFAASRVGAASRSGSA